MTQVTEFVLIDNAESLQQFYEENHSVEWMGFDTEFVGEKRYYTLLCLIQVSTVNGFYLIDPLKIRELGPLLKMIQDPAILKITHAGDNDYRLLYSYYKILPKNVFDTQIAAGFLGYKYPISFSKLVEKEARVYLRKGYTVSDWESRPINQKQLQYALNDVIHLEKLWRNLTAKLEKLNRYAWVKEEFEKLEEADYYYSDPNKEALTNSLILGLSNQEQFFLIRLYQWRREQAEKRDYSKEMILPAKFIGAIVRNMRSGKGALLNHRRLPDKIIQSNWEVFNSLYQQQATEEEHALLTRIPVSPQENPKHDAIMEIIYLIIKYNCFNKNIAPDLVVNRSNFKTMKSEPEYFDETLAVGWRRDMIGDQMINWLRNRERLEIITENGHFTLRINED
jgi:ribonuclease D